MTAAFNGKRRRWARTIVISLLTLLVVVQFGATYWHHTASSRRGLHRQHPHNHQHNGAPADTKVHSVVADNNMDTKPSHNKRERSGQSSKAEDELVAAGNGHNSHHHEVHHHSKKRSNEHRLTQHEKHHVVKEREHQDAIGDATPLPSPPLAASLLSEHLEATSDVRGNLGPVSVVLSSKPHKDWIKDRWQAAKDMSGSPIPGEHWVNLKLKREVAVDRKSSFSISKIVLDWETAHASQYTLQGTTVDGAEVELGKSSHFKLLGVRKKSSKHNVDTLVAGKQLQTAVVDGGKASTEETKFTAVKLIIHKPGTQWGSSLWRFEVWGHLYH